MKIERWKILTVIMSCILVITILVWNGIFLKSKDTKGDSSESSRNNKYSDFDEKNANQNNVGNTDLMNNNSGNMEIEKNQIVKKVIGTVFDNESYSKVDGVRITVEGEEIYSTNEGYYEIENPKSESFTIKVEKDGYKTAIYTNYEPFYSPFEKVCSLPLFISKDTGLSIDFDGWDFWYYKKYDDLLTIYDTNKKDVLQNNIILFRCKVNGTVYYDETMSSFEKIKIKIEELELEAPVNKDGYFEFCNLPDGKYTFSIYYNGDLQSKYIGYSIHSCFGVTGFIFDMDRTKKIERYGY